VARTEIRERILTGALPPGTAIGLKRQAQELGMSIMPVREALQQLSQEGLVHYEPQRGAVVAPLSLRRMEDLYRVRIELEGLAVELACRHFTDEDYRRLSRLLDDFVAAYQSGDTRRGRELHLGFHAALYALARSPALDRLIPPLLDEGERYRVFTVGVRGTVAERRNEHQEILDAMAAHDEAAARERLTRHLARTVALARTALGTEAGKEWDV
jgi:DNA-binding GntR family transcriptional regulator